MRFGSRELAQRDTLVDPASPCSHDIKLATCTKDRCPQRLEIRDQGVKKRLILRKARTIGVIGFVLVPVYDQPVNGVSVCIGLRLDMVPGRDQYIVPMRPLTTRRRGHEVFDPFAALSVFGNKNISDVRDRVLTLQDLKRPQDLWCTGARMMRNISNEPPRKVGYRFLEHLSAQSRLAH